MPDYLVRLVQMHESFREAELQALADVAEVPIEFVKYEEEASENRRIFLLVSITNHGALSNNSSLLSASSAFLRMLQPKRSFQEVCCPKVFTNFGGRVQRMRLCTSP
jgi:tRNA G10  N-methylase Trm11